MWHTHLQLYTCMHRHMQIIHMAYARYTRMGRYTHGICGGRESGLKLHPPPPPPPDQFCTHWMCLMIFIMILIFTTATACPSEAFFSVVPQPDISVFTEVQAIVFEDCTETSYDLLLQAWQPPRSSAGIHRDTHRHTQICRHTPGA